jgi:hypothetical protein
MAEVTSTQVYTNKENFALDTVYFFSFNPNAAFVSLEAEIGDR